MSSVAQIQRSGCYHNWRPELRVLYDHIEVHAQCRLCGTWWTIPWGWEFGSDGWLRRWERGRRGKLYRLLSIVFHFLRHDLRFDTIPHEDLVRIAREKKE